jgi:membrane protease YdiL (CAAX protease family)
MATEPYREAAADGAAHGVAKPVAIAIGTTALVTALSYGLPLKHSATGVGIAFLAVTYLLVLRHDEEVIRHHGLSLAGLLEPVAIDRRRLAHGVLASLAWCAAICAVVLPPFFFGFRAYWHVRPQFVFHWPASFWDDVLGQMLVIALPEEAFYRGYLQTALEDAMGTRWNVLGVRLGWGCILSAALFAVGHLATETHPARLAVFFPALLFGWLRARTQGVGASALLHAIFNLFSATLARGYGMTG